MASKNTQMRKEQEDKEMEALKAFIADIQKVELQHGIRLIAVMEYTERGIRPIITSQKIEKKEEQPLDA